MSIKLSLLVIRVADLERSAEFYRAIGLSFVKEKHGSGPEHYSSDMNGTILELYPAQPNAETTSQPRLGFVLGKGKLEETITRCQSAGGKLYVLPKESPWGFRAVIADPDGHKVELSESVT